MQLYMYKALAEIKREGTLQDNATTMCNFLQNLHFLTFFAHQ